MLEVRHISVHYGDVQAVKDVSLQVEEGNIAVLLGPNAAGKSTTLRAISGILRVRSGEIALDGEPIHNRPAHEIVERGVVHVPEGRGLFGSLTVLENLELGAYTSKARRIKRDNLAKVFTLFPRLAERRSLPAGSLSGGEQQMVAGGRALMARPAILAMDEPSLGLAPVVVDRLFAVLQTIRERGLTILLIEQNVQQTLEMADRGYVMENGHIVLTGSGRELLGNEHLKTHYLGV